MDGTLMFADVLSLLPPVFRCLHVSLLSVVLSESERGTESNSSSSSSVGDKLLFSVYIQSGISFNGVEKNKDYIGLVCL